MPAQHRPLIPDHQRQAQDALQGYAYQIWHSLLAWLTLKEDQILFLEGAEDFDVVEGEAATAVQVKHSGRKITLRANAVQDALTNFLQTSRRNPSRLVLYRLLTTARITIERGSPFGKGVAGLSLWEAARRTRDEEAAARIRDFLLKNEASGVLREFLVNASPATVLTDLISNVSWHTGSVEVGMVEQAVNEALINVGDRLGVAPSVSRKVAGRLLRETLREAVKKKPQFLSRARLLEIFEEETTERVPHAQLAGLRQAQETLTTAFLDLFGGPASSTMVSRQGVEPVELTIPPLGFNPLPRSQLVDASFQLLRRVGALVLIGATGTGKSILAREVARRSGFPVVWASLGFENLRLGLFALQRLRAEKDRVADRRIFVLDNLELAKSRDYADRAGALVFELVNEGHYLVITSLWPVPASINRRLGSLAPEELRVPHFDRDEIKSFAGRSGCPEDMSNAWSAVIETQTAGHPQLVHAFVHSLSRRSWPSPTAKDLVSEPETVERERHDARSKLVQQVPASERELLYALSLYAGPFRRLHALAVGGMEVLALDRPGESFDLLVGPWIEQVNKEYYRLSPLLHGAASTAWAPEKVARLRVSVGVAVLEAGELGLLEAGSVLLLGLLGRSNELTRRVCIGLLQTPQKHIKTMARAIGWLPVWEFKGAGKQITDVTTLCFLRVLQYRVAANNKSELCMDLIQRWRADVEAIEDHVLQSFHRFALAGEVLVRLEAQIPPAQVLACLVDLDRLRAEAPQPIRSLLAAASLSHDNSTTEWIWDLSTGFLMVSQHCRSAVDVLNLLRAIRDLKEPVRDSLLAEYKGPPLSGALFVSSAWTSEAKKDQPNWQNATEALLAAILYGHRWSTSDIALAGYTGLAAVSAEYLGEEGAALSVLDRADKRLGRQPALDHQRASVYFRFDRHEKALGIWESFLAAWRTSSEGNREYGVTPTLACRMAAISAAKLGKWQRAAEWFEEGARRSASTLAPRFCAGFEADAAYCYWRAGLPREFIYAASRSLEILEVSGAEMDVGTRVAAKLISHTLLYTWTGDDRGEKSGTVEPVVGMNSNPDVNEEIASLRSVPIELNWLILSEAENLYLGESVIFARTERRLRQTSYPLIRSRSLQLAIDHAIREGNPAILPKLAQELANNSIVVARSAGSEDPLGRDDLGADVVEATALPFSSDFLAAALLVDKGEDLKDTLDGWRLQLSQLPAGGGLEAWLKGVREMLSCTVGELRSEMLGSENEREKRLVSAVLVTRRESLDPETRFAAHLLLYLLLRQSLWKNSVGDVLASLISSQWQTHANAPATLMTPRLSVPLIADTAVNKSRGWTKVAKMLLAASGAVRFRLTEEQLLHLKSDADVDEMALRRSAPP